MRHTLRTLFPLALALAVAGCKDTSKDANERHLVLLFTTDEHSNLFATSPELDDFIQMQNGNTLPTTGRLKGGVARRMTVLKAERDAAAARGVATLTLSSGDFSQGSLASAAWIATSPELAMMKVMGYDAVALGNHEFDLGPAALAQAVASAVSLADGTTPQRPPLVLTNINFSAASAADDGLAALYGEDKPIAPYRILTTSNGLRIGIVASMGVAAGTVAGAPAPVTFWTGATNEAKFADYAAKLQAGIDHLRGQGVDAVILLAHGGIGADAMHPGEDELLGLQLKGVDLILSGHSHLFTPQPRIMYGSGTAVPVVQPEPYGRNVGKVELVFKDDDSAPRPYLDPSGTTFIAVDDTVAPSADAAFTPPAGELFQRTVGYLAIGKRAVDASVTAPSFLEKTLSTITGTPITGTTPATAANLWNYPLGRLDFDVIGNAPGETNAMNLDTDGIRAAVRGGSLIGIPVGACATCPATEIAIQASGPIRGDLRPSAYEPNHALTFADIYHVVPLGGDPTASPAGATANDLQIYANAVPGYPLVKVNIPTAALRAAIEGTLQTGLLVNGDFFPGASGLVVQYDPTRLPMFNPANPLSPGWVTYMALENGTVLYDVSDPANAATGGFPPAMLAPTSFRSVATTLYVAGVAQALGIPLYDDSFTQLTTLTQLVSTVVRRGDGGAIKDFEALGQYVAVACATNAANPGFLPSVYDATTAEGAIPRRVVDCTGGCP